jgi:hypothetical protein
MPDEWMQRAINAEARVAALEEALRDPSKELIDTVASGIYGAVSREAPSTRRVAKNAIHSLARAVLGAAPSTPEPARCPTCDIDDPKFHTGDCARADRPADPWHDRAASASEAPQ